MSIFNQQSSLFNTPAQQASNVGGGFGSTNTNQTPTQQKPKLDLFGSINWGSSTAQPQQNGGTFGSATSQPTQSGGLFGSTATQPAQTGGLFGSTSQPQQSNSIFSQPQNQQPAATGLFQNLGTNSQQQNAQQSGGLFGSTQPKPGGLFGSATEPQQSTSIFNPPQPQQQSGGLFQNLCGSTQQPQQQQAQQQTGSNIFGNFGQSTQQTQQQQQPSVLGQTQSRLFQDTQMIPYQKTVPEQIQIAANKWNPNSSDSPFRTYLYNQVPVESAPFYGPSPGEDEKKWEEALANKPSPGSIPVSVHGFEQLGARMKTQFQNLTILRGRLHEINEGLDKLLQHHDLETVIRVADCRRKHLVLSKRCLYLAAKTQVLRNRGYAMDAAEEELRKKLFMLERSVTDPGLSARREEIWARMIGVRERGRLLVREFETAGRDLDRGEGEIDEEVMKRAKKILEDYSSQLAHLAKELEEVQNDWKEYEQSQPLAITNGR